MTINLTAVAIYREAVDASLATRDGKSTLHPQLELIGGASAATRRVSGRAALSLGSVPMDKGFLPPDEGLLLLFGLYDRLESLERYQAQAQASGARVATATYAFELGPSSAETVSQEGLTRLGWAYVRQLAAPLQAELAECFASLSDRAGQPHDIDGRSASPIQQLARRPDLWGQVLREHPALQHLRMLVVPVGDMAIHPGGFRQLAFVRPGTPCREVETDATDVDLHLPPHFMQAERPCPEAMH